MSRCIILLGNRVLGEFEFDFDPPPIEVRVPGCIMRSKAFFCPECGEVWARFYLQGFNFSTPILRRCERHGGGTLIDVETFQYLDSAPESFWHRELQLLAQDPVIWSDALDLTGVRSPTN